MAIKIDLLPGYVKLERQRNRALGASLALLALIGGGLLLELERKKLELQTIVANRQVIEVVAAKTTATQGRVTTLTSEAAPIDSGLAFMVAATKSGPERATLLNQIRQFIFENSVVTSIDISNGQDVLIKATVRDPNQYAAFLFNLRRASDVNNGPLFAGLPTASGVGGFPNQLFIPPTPDTDQPVVVTYPINIEARGKLKNPVVLPPDPTLGGGAAAPVAGAAPGAPTPNPSAAPART